MPIKQYKPTSPGRRGASGHSLEEVTNKKPQKSLLLPNRKRGGRNNQGRITVRHRGGGAKRQLRIIDFKRDKVGVPGRVASIEYDPNRSAHIALINYVDGDKRYILWPLDLKIGDIVTAGPKSEIKEGNSLPMRSIPAGTVIHNIELSIGRGGQMARSAGSSAQLMAKEGEFVTLRLPSGEMRRVSKNCSATVGQVGNLEHSQIKLGRAGRSRLLGRRPRVRGAATNPSDHPHGGGEGKAPVGMPGPKSPWGKPTLGHRTRRHKETDKYIVRRRYQG